MATGPGKDQDDPVHVNQQHQSKDSKTAFTTGAPRAAPAEFASPPPPSGVEQSGEGRIPGIDGSGSAAAAVNGKGKKVAPLSPPSSSRGSRDSTSSADAAERTNASSRLPSSAHLERVDEQPGEGSSPGADRKGDKAAVLTQASCSRDSERSDFSTSTTSSSADAEAAEVVSRKADEKQVICPAATKEKFLKQFTSRCNLKLSEDISENGYDDNCFNSKRKLGNKIPLMVFAEQYNNNTTFMQKFEILQEKYHFVRLADGDGSCFYRSFIFSYLEKAVAIPDKDVRTNEAIRLRERIENAMHSCLRGLHRMTDAQFERAFSGSDFVMTLIEDGLSAEELHERELADSITSKILPLLRTLAEIELCAKESYYKWFLTDHVSIFELCADEVRPDIGEASHLTIVALVNAIGIAVTMGIVDMTDGGIEMTFSPESGNVSPVAATVLYMPGHYNVLYES
ncbi:uncharacterized protein LOC124690731 [Lolium rigidum]|uniref:uncharacterized protein LOC124690731 n=1 Tax=Lolium rigidum TaxID=89674 RepID=UPI001F5CC631|nr:uncharacterized protein LOC124690731 [Lolium rigidum]